jgi:hypothetical protein
MDFRLFGPTHRLGLLVVALLTDTQMAPLEVKVEPPSVQTELLILELVLVETLALFGMVVLVLLYCATQTLL